MDIETITSYRTARTRADLTLAPGEVVLGGGTWLMSEPQPDTTGFVDLAGLEWEPIEVTDAGLRIAATCTIAHLVAWAEGRTAPAKPEDWTALSIVVPAANALLASFKIWNTATVGGNVCRSFAAASMVSLCVAFDGQAEIWMPDGSERSIPVADLVTGNGTNTLAPGEVLRALMLPADALTGRAALRKIALAEHGRSGAVVTGRVDADGTSTFGITAATSAPTVVRFETLPTADALTDALSVTTGYYTDPLGSADWRRGVAAVLAEDIRSELEAAGTDAVDTETAE